MRQTYIPPWVWIVGLFFFGYSILGVVTSIIVTILGFPYEWSCAITIGLIGIAAYLFYNRYTVWGWLLAACGVFIAISIMAIGNAIISTEPEIPQGLASYLDAQSTSFEDVFNDPYGANVWYDDYFYDYEFNRIDIRNGQDYGIVYYDTFSSPNFVDIEVIFPEIETLGGQWAFVEGQSQASGGLQGVYPARPDLNWLSADDTEFIFDAEPSTAYPYSIYSIPSNNLESGFEFTLDVSLTIITPLEDGSIEEQTLQRNVNLYVASDFYYNFVYDYSNWQRSQFALQFPLLLILVGGSVISAGASVWLIRSKNALERLGSNNFIMVMRKPSGLKTLGVEAYTLDDLKADTTYGLTQGAFLGFVSAQSPAGRSGLRAGDIVIKVDEKLIKAPRDLERAMSKFEKGHYTHVEIMRHGESMTTEVKF